MPISDTIVPWMSYWLLPYEIWHAVGEWMGGGHEPAMSRRRILSIDGGGIKGVFPVSFLAKIESTLGIDSVADYFDLMAGTSVGGIIALGLGLGTNARDLLEFFKKNGSVIFPTGFVPTSTFRLCFGGERYSSLPLRTALIKTFGHKTLGDSKVRLLIPSFDATSADIHVYKTRHDPRLRTDHTLKAVDIAMATAAAPTYFPGYDSEHSITLVDGGVWANNPVGIAFVEAVGLLGWSGDEIDVLSLGRTEESVDFQQRGHGRAFWLSSIKGVKKKTLLLWPDLFSTSSPPIEQEVFSASVP